MCSLAVWCCGTRLGWRARRPPPTPPPVLPPAGKFHLILVESRIHRLARYYKRSKKLPPNWK